MSKIAFFKPRKTIEAEANLAEFIRFCKEELTVFGADLVWREQHWKNAGVSFSNLDQKSRAPEPENVLASPFIDFAKAYFRYQQGHKPAMAKREMPTFKCLERALLEESGKADVLDLTASTFDRAAVLAAEYFSAAVAYQVGGQLKKLADFVSDNGLISMPIDWTNPHKRVRDTVRTGAKAKAEREKKLPNEDALNALAEIFASNPQHDRDVFTSSVAALLICCPSRIGEVLSLRVDCEVYEKKRNGEEAYGLRFQPSKGAAPQIKWIPDSMASVAQEAIARLKRISQEARSIAKWYEDNHKGFYRHTNCPNVSEQTPLTRIEACEAIGRASDTAGQAYTSLSQLELPYEDGENTLETLDGWARSRLPEGFPYYDKERGVLYSEALFCFKRNQFHGNRGTSPIEISKPTPNWVNDDLENQVANGQILILSIFERYGFNEGREQELKVTTHQFRHLLNTMAQRGGMSQSEIAKWSGRKDMKQNRTYDHMTEFELVQMIRDNDGSLKQPESMQELKEQIAKKLPIDRKAIDLLMIPTAHITEYGYCIHDYTMSPCQKHLDCLNCTEQICVKGDRRLNGLQELVETGERLIAKADEEIANGNSGADRWYQHQSLTVARLKELVSIIQNPAVEDGAIIKLRNPNEFSPLRRAIANRAEQPELDSKETAMLNDLRELLGGN